MLLYNLDRVNPWKWGNLKWEFIQQKQKQKQKQSYVQACTKIKVDRYIRRTDKLKVKIVTPQHQ